MNAFIPKRIIPVFLLMSILLILGSPAWGGEKRISNDIGMQFIRVEPGVFSMGSPKTELFRDQNEPLHTVKLTRAYYLQETEVTLGQWWAVMGKKWVMKRRGSPNMPVTRVSFYNCEKFIKALNKKGRFQYRLPTEAEWEYACRAGTTTAYSWGDTIDCSRAMYGNNKKKSRECIVFFKGLNIPANGPAPVKSFKPNPWGFFDMHGNVWEWCQDIYKPYNNDPKTGNSMITTKNRVRRGGSWYKYPQYLRSANRAYAHPGAKFKTTGFRLVIEAD